VNIPSLEWSLTGENLSVSIPAAIIDWQANLIRLPVKQASWLSSTDGPAYKALVDGIVAQASAAGVYVLLDQHEYQQPSTTAATFWTDAANHYKNNPAVLFGLFNEPHGTTWTVWKNGDANGPGMQGLVNAIRATGANNVITAGGLDWAYDLSGIIAGYALTDTAPGNGIVYETHIYPWKGSWQERVGNVAQVHPVLVGEIGHPDGTSYIGLNFEDDSTWVPRVLDWVDTRQLHWTGWSLHPTATPSMIRDWTYTPTAHWGAPALLRLQSYQNPSSEKIAGGTVIGTPGTRLNPTSGVLTDPVNGAVAAFNGVYGNYFDGPSATGSWTGLDLGKPTRITKIKFMPRQNNGSSMVNGVFQGSGSATFASGVTTLHTVTTAPAATGGVYTTALVSDTGLYRYVRYMGPANSYSHVASILFHTGDGVADSAASNDAIVDNTAAAGVVRLPSSADWPASTQYPGFHGTNYLHDNNAAKGAKSVRFTPRLLSTGNYEVFARWSADANRADNVPIDIVHSGGTSFVEVNQRTNGGQWVSLGVYPFDAGATGSVQIKTTGTNGYVIADAVRFVRIHDLVVDNQSSGFSPLPSGSDWGTSTSFPGYYGANYRHDNDAGKGSKSARFTPTIDLAGNYQVFAWWTANSNRASNVPFTITHSDGSTTVTQDQRVNGSQWVSLGTYPFAAGASGNVLIQTTGTSGYVIADAVRFTRVAEDIVIDNQSAGFVVTPSAADWGASTSFPGYYGGNYRHDNNDGKGLKSARFTPTLGSAGNYEVFAWWSANSNRASNVPFTITHSGGATTVTQDQRTNGGQWVSLGTYAFNAGTAGNVLIQTTGTSGYVIADAVRFLKE
ncbi:MAG TPA: cellulase family glycosylhydrolase, partial [Rariglobus sp.]